MQCVCHPGWTRGRREIESENFTEEQLLSKQHWHYKETICSINECLVI